jgi:hypothetical protein
VNEDAALISQPICGRCGVKLATGWQVAEQEVGSPKREQTCPICGDVLAYNSTTCYRCSPKAKGIAPPPSETFGIISVMVSIVGVILVIGNLTGLFPTFPFAGFILMLIGGLIAKLK